jgi:hypothetical protein
LSNVELQFSFKKDGRLRVFVCLEKKSLKCTLFSNLKPQIFHSAILSPFFSQLLKKEQNLMRFKRPLGLIFRTFADSVFNCSQTRLLNKYER